MIPYEKWPASKWSANNITRVIAPDLEGQKKWHAAKEKIDDESHQTIQMTLIQRHLMISKWMLIYAQHLELSMQCTCLTI